jgi:3-beta hydroxysteroid dehydrogenase/isomerase family
VFWTPQRKSSISLGNPTLHKPHVATHSRQEFVDTNITGTLNLLEESVAAGVESFIYTSTTSVLGDALVPPRGAPAAWITEDSTLWAATLCLLASAHLRSPSCVQVWRALSTPGFCIHKGWGAWAGPHSRKSLCVLSQPDI